MEKQITAETQRRLEVVQEIGKAIEEKTRSKVFIFVVGSVRDGTANEKSDIDMYIILLNEKADSIGAAANINAVAEQICRDIIIKNKITITNRCGFFFNAIARNEEELARKFIHMLHEKEFSEIWNFFKGGIAYASGAADKSAENKASENLRASVIENIKKISGSSEIAKRVVDIANMSEKRANEMAAAKRK